MERQVGVNDWRLGSITCDTDQSRVDQQMSDDPILVTGAAGFIGFHVAKALLSAGSSVVGVDSLNSYYDPALKRARLAQLKHLPGFTFSPIDLADRAATSSLFSQYGFRRVVHMAAQAGVRYSIENPQAYMDANLQGFLNVLEGCRGTACRHLIYASSSSVYGANTKIPFAVGDAVDHPISFYAATKRSNELMAYSYSHLYRLPVTGLRFFTVYGPWGRPDMAVFQFTRAILAGEPIRIFNHGNMRRDFTYIDDVTNVLVRLVNKMPDPIDGLAPARLYNVGNHRPEELMRVIEILEGALGRPALREMLPMQPGDVHETFADVADLMRDVGFRPDTPLETGLGAFVAWYRSHYTV